MHQVLGHLLYCFIYIDDVIVASDSVEQRLDHLQAVFTLLQANHLVINKVLGKQVGEHGICRLRSSLSALKKFPPPRKFCQGLAEVVKPMTDSLADKPADFKVTPDFMTACTKAKEMLSMPALLNHPHPTATLSIPQNAFALWRELGQGNAGPPAAHPLPLRFVPPCLQVYNNSSQLAPHSIIYINLQELMNAQMSCSNCTSLSKIKDMIILLVLINGVTILFDILTSVAHPCLPSAFRRKVFNTVHNFALPGMRATHRLMSSRGMGKFKQRDISRWMRECYHFHSSEVTYHVVPRAGHARHFFNPFINGQAQ